MVWWTMRRMSLDRGGGVRKQQELFTVKTILALNNTEDNVDSHKIGQVAESATKRDNS